MSRNKKPSPLAFLKGIQNTIKILGFGAQKIKSASIDFWLAILFVFTFFGTAVFGNTNLLFGITKSIFGDPLPIFIGLFFKMTVLSQYLSMSLIFSFAVALLYGYSEYAKEKRLQLTIERSGLKASTGEIPEIVSVSNTDNYKTQILVESFGVSLEEFQAKKGRLTSGFRKRVEKIEHDYDVGRINITLSNVSLPKLIKFDKLFEKMEDNYSFIVGQSLDGPIYQKIQTLPHLLISGATGGGKSVFFRSTVLSLLKSSPYLQVYLLDLKRGVEVKEFEELPNVRTVKNKTEATVFLGELVKEMNKRYIYLESKGFKTINPKRDKMDLIVVGIDEAASLFKKEQGNIARTHIEELGRLARASGIHLIPSTQKPVKNAIDTDTLDNLPGRMTFRMVSHAASNAAIGSNIAKKIPAIQGRAIWTNGSDPTEVQAPFITDKEVKKEIELLKIEFENKSRKNHQNMLSYVNVNSLHQAKIKKNGETEVNT